MAKGNMLLGYSRGSVGDVTFSRLNGQQITKARNRKPANPRTKAQMLQRSLFSSAVKFYQQCAGKFYIFAFEDKRANESDYNAFMRANTKRGTNITKAAMQATTYPAIGYWQVSRGSLPTLQVDSATNQLNYYTGIKIAEGEEVNIKTVGQLSQYLVQLNEWAQGDMLTFLRYGCAKINASAELPSLAPNLNGYNTYFDYSQVIVDPSSATPLESASLKVERNETSGELMVASYASLFDETIAGAAFIHTRKTSNGIKASTQDMVWSGLWKNAYNASKEDGYINNVLADWQAQNEAILEPTGKEELNNNIVAVSFDGGEDELLVDGFKLYGAEINPGPVMINIALTTSRTVINANDYTGLIDIYINDEKVEATTSDLTATNNKVSFKVRTTAATTKNDTFYIKINGIKSEVATAL